MGQFGFHCGISDHHCHSIDCFPIYGRFGTLLNPKNGGHSRNGFVVLGNLLDFFSDLHECETNGGFCRYCCVNDTRLFEVKFPANTDNIALLLSTSCLLAAQVRQAK